MGTDSDSGNAVRKPRAAAQTAEMKNRLQSTLNFEDDPKDIPFSDSDEDKTYKPKGSDNGKDEKSPLNNKRALGGDQGGSSPKSARDENTPLVGSCTEIIPDNQNLKIGDFVVLTTESKKDNVPIWRYDCHATLQRYNPFYLPTGTYLHKSANIFSGFIQSDRNKFTSISVKFLSADSTTYTVKVLSKSSGWSGPSISKPTIEEPKAPTDKRGQSKKETSGHQEAFEVYIQALISQGLDSNFLEEIISDNDEYFLNNIEKITKVTNERLSKLPDAIKEWTSNFKQQIDLCSTLCSKPLSSTSHHKSKKCTACNHPTAPITILIQLSGKPYIKTTLKLDKANESKAVGGSFELCQKCDKLTELYHKLTHQKYLLYQVCQTVIDSRKKSSPSMESATVLNELLADSKWLKEQFSRIQDTWADVDCLQK